MRNAACQTRFCAACIYHRIELTEDLIEAAVESMARAADSDSAGVGMAFPNLDAATRAVARARFWEIRQRREIDKKPSTAEPLTWLCILSARRWRCRPWSAAACGNYPELKP